MTRKFRQHQEIGFFYENEHTHERIDCKGIIINYYEDGVYQIREEKTGLTWMMPEDKIYPIVELKPGNPNYEYKVAAGLIPNNIGQDKFKPASTHQRDSIIKIGEQLSYTRLCMMMIGGYKKLDSLSKIEAEKIIVRGTDELTRRTETKELIDGMSRAGTIAALAEKKRISREEKSKLHKKKMGIKKNLKYIKKMGM